MIDYESSVEDALKSCSDQIDANREKVLEVLLEGVARCEPRIHPNAELKLKQKARLAAKKENVFA